MSEARSITPVREAQVVPITGATMMDVITRAASDPSVDVDKLERLLGMAERVRAEEARTAYATAMNACQAELGRVAADASNPQTKSQYASYPALDRQVRPVYSRHGFSLSFGTEDGAPADHMRLVCHVAHASGHVVDHRIDMPADGKGAKGGDVMTKTHAMGAAASYGQRYLLKLIFNIAVGDDNDGNAPRTVSSAAERAFADVNLCDTREDLRKWKAEKFPGLANIISDRERSDLVSLVNRRAKALRDQEAGQ